MYDQRIINYLHSAGPALLWRTKEEARKGRSWRGFKVGCTVLAWNGYLPEAKPMRECLTEPDPLYEPISPNFYAPPGANVKLDQHAVNTCAERFAVMDAIRKGFPHIVAIFVAGEFQPDGESGLLTPTLHPCGECRRTLLALPEVPNDVIIVTTGLEDDAIIETHTLEQLIALHGPAR